jgi:hypothetical protein
MFSSFSYIQYLHETATSYSLVIDLKMSKIPLEYYDQALIPCKGRDFFVTIITKPSLGPVHSRMQLNIKGCFPRGKPASMYS